MNKTKRAKRAKGPRSSGTLPDAPTGNDQPLPSPLFSDEVWKLANLCAQNGSPDFETMFSWDWSDVAPLTDEHLGRKRIYHALCLMFHCDEVLKNEYVVNAIRTRARWYGLKIIHEGRADRITNAAIAQKEFEKTYFLSKRQEQKFDSLTRYVGGKGVVSIKDLESIDLLPGAKWDNLKRELWEDALKSIPHTFSAHQPHPGILERDAALHLLNELVGCALSTQRRRARENRQAGVQVARKAIKKKVRK